MKRVVTELLYVAFLLGYFLLMIYSSKNTALMITIPTLCIVPFMAIYINRVFYQEGKEESKLLFPYLLFSFFVVATNGMSLYYSDYIGIDNYVGLPNQNLTMVLPMILLLITSLIYFILNTRRVSHEKSISIVKITNISSIIIYFLTFFLILF